MFHTLNKNLNLQLILLLLLAGWAGWTVFTQMTVIPPDGNMLLFQYITRLWEWNGIVARAGVMALVLTMTVGVIRHYDKNRFAESRTYMPGVFLLLLVNCGKFLYTLTPALLLAMVGGGKAGNIISPNPNTIAAADAFKVDLTALILENVFPALIAFAAAVALAALVARSRRGQYDVSADMVPTGGDDAARSSLWAALAGPVVVVALLVLRPLAGIAVDPMIALPAGGLVALVATRHIRQAVSFSEFGLSKVAGVAVLLVGTGTIAGIVKASGLNADMISLMNLCHLPTFALAPVSGVLMAGATASTTAGATVASQTFAGTLLAAGVPAVSAAAMIHAGAIVLDSLPHGSFFHASGGAVSMPFGERLRLVPYDALVGLAATLAATIKFMI